MSILPAFSGNDQLSLGVELELQLVDLHHFNLAREAEDFLRRLSEVNHPGEIKPEITQAMIEINSSVHTGYTELLQELREVRDVIVQEAKRAYLGVCGGGTHPFQKWKAQRIFKAERYASISEQLGYLAKQVTVFGQHIHIACPNGNDALYLCHALARYMPHFIALAAASPFSQGVDTAFDCARLATINALPTSGTPPWMLSWTEFENFFARVANLQIVQTMKDFHWDIRPKPEFGTVELRINDTPLTVEKAAALAAYAQMLVRWLLRERVALTPDIYLAYSINRFRAARYGLQAEILDTNHSSKKPLADDIVETCDHLIEDAIALNSKEALDQIRAAALLQENGAKWLRERYRDLQSLNDVVRAQTKLWMT